MEKVTAGRDALGEFAPQFAALNDDVLFGQVWAREEKLSPRDRSLLTVTALMACGVLDSSLQHKRFLLPLRSGYGRVVHEHRKVDGIAAYNKRKNGGRADWLRWKQYRRGCQRPCRYSHIPLAAPGHFGKRGRLAAGRCRLPVLSGRICGFSGGIPLENTKNTKNIPYIPFSKYYRIHSAPGRQEKCPFGGFSSAIQVFQRLLRGHM